MGRSPERPLLHGGPIPVEPIGARNLWCTKDPHYGIELIEPAGHLPRLIRYQ